LPYRYIDDISVADAAIEVNSDTLEGIFIDSGKALTNTMVDDLKSIRTDIEYSFKVESKEIDLLLFEFLEKLVIEKDANQMLFSEFEVKINQTKNNSIISVIAHGEHIDYNRHELCADVKAVTLHKFNLTKEKENWKAEMILDI